VKLIKEKKTGKEYAVKMITKKISENEEVMKEIEVMKAVSEHPGVIHLSEVYEDDENYNLVIELFVGVLLITRYY
jgi:serine/threonine protein kinase